MIDFTHVTEPELTELKQIIQKNVEKSEMERIFLFTNDTKEKGRLFLLCYRFLLNIYNVIEEGTLKKELAKEIVELKEHYKKTLTIIEEIDKMNFGRNNYERKLFYLVNSKNANNLIDLFSILTERVNIIKLSRLKGILLEGKSKEAHDKVFKEI